MKYLQIFLIGLVAIEHVYFMILEMFYWTKPKGLKTFGLTKEKAESSKVLAANQGLYNGFLAAGLIWSILEIDQSYSLAIFFLTFVIIAGIYGAYTTRKVSLIYVQSLPALLALFSIHL